MQILQGFVVWGYSSDIGIFAKSRWSISGGFSASKGLIFEPSSVYRIPQSAFLIDSTL